MNIPETLTHASADEIIDWLEEQGYCWSLDHVGRLIEARIWEWPFVVGRYRPATVEPLADLLRGAIYKTVGKKNERR